MQKGLLISWLGLIAMTLAIGNGFINGDFGADGAELLANAWGIVSLVDLYVGFILFSMWIVFREGNRWVAAIWVLLMMVLGFFTAALYLIIAFHQCRGDWLAFFLKDRREEVLKREHPGSEGS